MKHALPLFVASALALPAQQAQVIVPNIAGLVNVDRPFAGGIGRYQQWFQVAALQAAGAGIALPMRIELLEFFAGSPPTSQAAQIDCEIWMGHGNGVLGSAFDSNYSSPPILVKTRALVPLIAGGVGAVVLTLPFTTRFTWDSVRPIVLEVRVFGNSLGSAPFNYNFRGSTTSLGVTSRVYQAGSAVAVSGTVTGGMGMMTRFTARPGAVVSFGPPGCAGEGGFVPVASVLQIPSPAITWTHQLTAAASQRPALWVIGDINGPPFPVDLLALLGFSPSTCFLTNNAVNAIAVMTVGGGAGGGLATLPIALPATTNYVGVNLYTQWVVLDPLAPNGVLSVSNSHRSIVAPLGG
ncbi:MAG: hypothetical protein WAT39_03480 [Planctomycetota bacterium]